MKSPQEQFEILRAGATAIISENELLEKLKENRPLRVKLGFDPSSPDIHLGHAVILEKIRQFQDLGHQAVIIIGDYTAMIGDPTGRSKTRPALEPDQIAQNARTYQDQIFKIIDPDKTEIRRNSEWFAKMTYADVLKLNARMSVARMMERDDFKKRFDSGVSITLTEFQYPLMQGHDSVMIHSDIELGGNDQLFNNLVGRDLQHDAGQSPQTVMVMPILEGLDGVQKMSKSLDNYIGVAEPAPAMFGKAMSISDELMARWYPLILGIPLDTNAHPMERKKYLAHAICAKYHGTEEADSALRDFETRFSKKDLASSELPIFTPTVATGSILETVEAAYLSAFSLKKSRGDIRKLLQQGSVQLNGQKITDPFAQPALTAGSVLKLDKTHAVRIGSMGKAVGCDDVN